MDDMWGDDLPDDIIEECVLLASQATSTAVVSPKNKDTNIRTIPEFKSPTAVLNYSHHEKKTSIKPSTPLPSTSESGYSSAQSVNPLGDSLIFRCLQSIY